MVAPWLPATSSSSHRMVGTVLLSTPWLASSTVSRSEPSDPLQPWTRSMVPRRTFFAVPVRTPLASMFETVLRPRWRIV